MQWGCIALLSLSTRSLQHSVVSVRENFCSYSIKVVWITLPKKGYDDFSCLMWLLVDALLCQCLRLHATIKDTFTSTLQIRNLVAVTQRSTLDQSSLHTANLSKQIVISWVTLLCRSWLHSWSSLHRIGRLVSICWMRQAILNLQLGIGRKHLTVPECHISHCIRTSTRKHFSLFVEVFCTFLWSSHHADYMTATNKQYTTDNKHAGLV